MGKKMNNIGGTGEMLNTVQTVSFGVDSVAGEMREGEGDKGLGRGLSERVERGHSLVGSREDGLALLWRTMSRKQSLQTGA